MKFLKGYLTNRIIDIFKRIPHIRNSFCEMICEMAYGRITVKELCERAMINKKTLIDLSAGMNINPCF